MSIFLPNRITYTRKHKFIYTYKHNVVPHDNNIILIINIKSENGYKT